MPHFNVFENATRDRRTAHTPMTDAKNMGFLRGRAQYCATNANNYTAREWYRSVSRAASRQRKDKNKVIYVHGDRRRFLVSNINDFRSVPSDEEETASKNGGRL